MAGYELAPEVEQDLFEIWSTIALDDIAAANGVEEELRQTFDNLAEFPHQGHWRRDLSSRLRFRAVWEYLVAYRPEPQPILIVGVLHGRRNPKTIAGILGSRKSGVRS